MLRRKQNAGTVSGRKPVGAACDGWLTEQMENKVHDNKGRII
jgi:hypothetical protein